MRQPDIEIYLRDADHQAVVAWLEQAIGPCTPWQRKGQTFKCLSGDVEVTWLPQAVGKWHSLYLESDATPWADDLACAPGSWDEKQGEEDADRWLRVSDEGVTEIAWRTS